MRERAAEVAPGASLGLWRDTERFIRTGGQGEWQAFATPADQELYRAPRVAARAPAASPAGSTRAASRLLRR